MKKLLLFVFLSLFFLQSKAQDPQLFENEWYLQKVIIDGVEYYPPYSSIVGRLILSLESISIYHPICEESIGSSILEYISNNSFTLENDVIILLGSCGQPDVNEFMSKHYSIYYTSGYFIAKNPFTYTLTTESGILTLTIVNSDGDQAIYPNELLSNQDFSNSSFTIYPNPVKDFLLIDNTRNIIIISIKIYDVLGRLVVVEKGNVSQLDMSKLNSGLLFVKIETNEGVITKKIIKE